MKTYLIHRWDAMRNSFWFVPALMSLAALALAIACTSTDGGPIESWFVDAVPWIGVSTSAARASLTAIASAMVSIAGIVFSVMLVTLSITSSQYGSRLLRTFMSDMVTQTALGMLVGTSLFCMLALAGIQNSAPDSSSVNISVIVGLVLAIVSLAVLIGFIHHVASLIQAPNVVAEVARDLNDSFERLFPEQIGAENEPKALEDADLPAKGSGSPVRSSHEGYLQAIDTESLMLLATQDDLFIRVLVKPGDFVERQQPLVEVWSRDAVSDDREEGHQEGGNSRDFGKPFDERVNAMMIAGRRRTPRQDAECALEELVEVAVRALSPGINDPFTAMSCIDYLAASLGRVSERRMPSPYRYDDEDVLRIVARGTNFATLMNAAFDPIRQHGYQNVAVAIRLLEAFQRISRHITCEDRRAMVREHADRLRRDFRELAPHRDDGDQFESKYQGLLEDLQDNAKFSAGCPVGVVSEEEAWSQ